MQRPMAKSSTVLRASRRPASRWPEAAVEETKEERAPAQETFVAMEAPKPKPPTIQPLNSFEVAQGARDEEWARQEYLVKGID